jgi:hypothetical protein
LTKKGAAVPTVDFTLADVRKLVREETGSERENTRNLIKAALVDERESTRRLIHEELQEQFINFAENNLTPALEDIDDQFDEIRERLDRIEIDVKGIRRTVRKHSADIAELQAARGL